MANSRLSDRASFHAEVDVLSIGEPMPQRLWGENLSEAGMFLQTTKPFHPGDRIALRFDVAEYEVHVRAAEVVWIKPFEPISVDGALPGVGVRFLSVDPPSRAAIRRFVHVKEGASDVPAPPPEPEHGEGDWCSLDSLKPLSLPPFDTAPPIEVTPSIIQEVEESVAAPPRDAEHALAGWRFDVDGRGHGAAAQEEEELMPPPRPKAETHDEEAAWSFASGPPRLPAEPDDIHERATQPPSLGAEEPTLSFDPALDARVNADFFDGKLSVLELPQVERRAADRRAARATRAGRIAVAAGLLAAGGALGIFLGYEEPIAAPDDDGSSVLAQAEQKAEPIEGEVVPVAVAERGLPSVQPPSEPESAEPTPADAKPAEASEPVLTGQAPEGRDAKEAPPASSGGMEIEWGRVTVPLEGGAVTRSFALDNPPRVVVDLEGSKLAKPREDEVGDKGIARLRFGRPDPVHVRVVVELSSDKTPRDITTLKRQGTLVIAWH